MGPYYADESVTLYYGDCLDVLRELPDSSVDSVVTDPPYGLEFMGRDWDGADGFRRSLNSADAGRDNVFGRTSRKSPEYRALHTFQEWCQQWATECLRILKPGGHLVAFGGSRTWHRLAVAVEDSGFEIRDSIAWLYSSGFPKSMDVSKAIDKARDDEAEVREVCRWLRARIDEHPEQSIALIAERFGFNVRMVEHWAARDTDSQPGVPKLDQWDILRELLSFDDEMDAAVFRLNLRKGEPGEAWKDRPIVGTVEPWTDRTNYALTSRDGLRRGESSNPAAQQWAGWGTALKPAFEPIVVGRKPLAGTVAGNVLTHGTGALNIDACRTATAAHDRGRWPTNVVLDDSQAVALDEQSGNVKGAVSNGRTGKSNGYSGGYGEQCQAPGYGDSGGASRFFPTFHYEAKAPASERPAVNGVQHPTVKPLDLMRWLVRLVTPPNGVVLEPFAGSGTTAEACVLEHMRCIAIEREADYLPLITSRLTKPMQVGFDFGSA